jgi:NADH-quinone oxidoreductase subunit G
VTGGEKKTVRTVIDGREYEFAEGTTILEAARSVGIQIPHYCYHPGLSIAGACRMCLVEIEKMPKLQISCYMTVADGMVVRTDTERVKRARKAILEFHLVNHPVDCPVCDQAGECGLQEYYMLHGLYISRLKENKVRKSRKAFQVGPEIMLDQERCILCSRCVRFCREVSRSHELGMFKRGDRSVIDTFSGQPVDNPYAGNVVDICPVGALTCRDSRFKTRAWYQETAESICPRCSRGCNIVIHYNTKRPWKNQGRKVVRLKPRFNAEVNKWWICDEGRFCFKFIDDADRLTAPLRMENGAAVRTGWVSALDYAAERMRTAAAAPDRDLAVLISAQASNEELFLLRKVFDERLPGWRPAFSMDGPFEPSEDDLLRRTDKNPNTAGVHLLGLDGVNSMSLYQLKQAALEGRIGALLVCYTDLPGLRDDLSGGWQAAFEKVGTLIYLGSNECSTSRLAQIVLPASTFAEREGTVTNFEHRIQIQRKAFDPAGESLPGWEIFRRLGESLGGEYSFADAREVFNALVVSVPGFSGLDYDKIGSTGCQTVTAKD